MTKHASLFVKVVPGSSRPGIKGMLGDRVKIALASPPQKGRANRELIKMLANAIGIPQSALAISAGGSSPMKTILVKGLSRDEIAARLGLTL